VKIYRLIYLLLLIHFSQKNDLSFFGDRKRYPFLQWIVNWKSSNYLNQLLLSRTPTWDEKRRFGNFEWATSNFENCYFKQINWKTILTSIILPSFIFSKVPFISKFPLLILFEVNIQLLPLRLEGLFASIET